MKQIFKLWMLLVSMALVITACTSNDDNPSDNPANPSSDELADYTIIFYGHGGANLDGGIVNNIAAFYGGDAESYKKVKIAVQYKFSTTENLEQNVLLEMENNIKEMEAAGLTQEQIEEEMDEENILKIYPDKVKGSDTYRFVVDTEEGFVEQFNDGNIYGPNNSDVSNPDSLMNFISWAAKACPAKNYVLIVSDHGGSYQPHDDLSYSLTRGLVNDDGHNLDNLSVSSLTHAIRQSGIRPQVVYMDCCLMNTAEYAFELKDLCDYIVSSTFEVPGNGGDYTILVNELAQADDIETALSNLCTKSIANWNEGKPGQEDGNAFFCDMSITRTAGLSAFGEKMREFTDALVAAYQSGDAEVIDSIDACTARTFKVEKNRPNYDLIDYVEDLFESVPSAFRSGLEQEMGTAFNACLVKQDYSIFLKTMGYEVDMSVLLGYENSYNFNPGQVDQNGEYPWKRFFADGSARWWYAAAPDVYYISDGWGSTFDATYKQLAFDKATGWSRWIEVNKQAPNLFSPTEWEAR